MSDFWKNGQKCTREIRHFKNKYSSLAVEEAQPVVDQADQAVEEDQPVVDQAVYSCSVLCVYTVVYCSVLCVYSE